MGHGWDWDRVGSNLFAAQACPLRASIDAQAAKPSTQLKVEDHDASQNSEIIALVGCHANHVVRRQHHCQRCKRGQLLPECCVEALQLSALVDCHVNHVVHR